MKLLPLAGGLALAAALVTVTVRPTEAEPLAAQPTTASAPVDLTVDGGHSSVVFRIKHNGAAYFYGRFNEVSGAIVYDAGDASKCSVEIDIDAQSVDTNSEKRDQHVLSPDFLDAKQFPRLSREEGDHDRDREDRRRRGPRRQGLRLPHAVRGRPHRVRHGQHGRPARQGDRRDGRSRVQGRLSPPPRRQPPWTP